MKCVFLYSVQKNYLLENRFAGKPTVETLNTENDPCDYFEIRIMSKWLCIGIYVFRSMFCSGGYNHILSGGYTYPFVFASGEPKN